MALVFPTTGPEPFVLSSLAGTLAVALLVFAVLPRRERLLRSGAGLYARRRGLRLRRSPTRWEGTSRGSATSSPAPCWRSALAGPRRRLLLALVALPLLYWQWQGAVRDVSRAAGDPSVQRDFYTPLLAALEARSGGAPVRIEIPPTQDRWEVYYMTPKFLLARGWERQLETADRHLFQRGLSPDSYRDWLLAHGVTYVALPDAPLDYLAHREAALIRHGLRLPDPDLAQRRVAPLRGARRPRPGRRRRRGSPRSAPTGSTCARPAPAASCCASTSAPTGPWPAAAASACGDRGPWTLVEPEPSGVVPRRHRPQRRRAARQAPRLRERIGLDGIADR